MGACAEQGPAFDSQELDQLQFDIEGVLLRNIFDAAYRVARSAGCVVGASQFSGSQDFADSTGLPLRLVYRFDGYRLELELQYDESEHAAEALAVPHARV